jgi:uncharacterized protein (DUF302 family)
MNETGLVTVKSLYSVKETIDRLSAALTSAGLSIFGRVDHAAGAQNVGMTLRPTDLVIFGNPKGGTPLMQDRQTSGIDLPLKALAWQDEQGDVWLTYNDPEWVARRHELGSKSEGAVKGMGQLLRILAADAAGKP